LARAFITSGLFSVEALAQATTSPWQIGSLTEDGKVLLCHFGGRSRLDFVFLLAQVAFR
jgi:hypothetical protein